MLALSFMRAIVHVPPEDHTQLSLVLLRAYASVWHVRVHVHRCLQLMLQCAEGRKLLHDNSYLTILMPALQVCFV